MPVLSEFDPASCMTCVLLLADSAKTTLSSSVHLVETQP